MPVMTQQHVWVKHVITPVSVLPGSDGDPIVFVDPDDQSLAEQNAVYGCRNCGEALVVCFDQPCDDERMDDERLDGNA